MSKLEDELFGLKSSRTGEYVTSKEADKRFEELEELYPESADKMLEKLGYKAVEIKDEIYKDSILISYEKCDDEGNFDRDITFWKRKTVQGTFSFTMQELKAINKKCEELGWI